MAKTQTNIPNLVTALVARTQFGQIMRRAKNGKERFIVDRRGEPQIIIMGIQDYLKTIAPPRPAVAAIREAAVRNGTSKMTMAEINRIIRKVRKERKNTKI